MSNMSKKALQEARESKEILQSVIDGELDLGVARTKIDEKLNSLEQEYAPELTNVKSQLADTAKEKVAVSKPKAIITIESDDALLTDYTVLLPFLSARNVPATLAVPPGAVGKTGRMNWTQLREVVENYDWTVCSHTVNEVQLGTVPLDVAEREMKESKEMIEAQGFKCEHLSYPNGSHSDAVMEIAKKYYKSSTTVTIGVNTAPVMSQKLYRLSLYTYDLTRIKTEIDKAVANNGWLIIYTHGDAFANDPLLQQKLSDAIDYAKTKNIDFMNHDDAWEEMGNVLDLGVLGSASVPNNFVLSKRGDAILNGIPINQMVVKEWEGESIDSLPKDFPDNQVTIINYFSGYNGGFPEHNQGTLIVHRGLWASLSWQMWLPYHKNEIYMRHASSDEAWRTGFENLYRLGSPNEYEVDIGTVSAGQVKQVEITINGVTNSDNVICTPKFGIQNNIMITSMVSATNTIRIRLFNPTDSDIVVGNRTFKINVVT